MVYDGEITFQHDDMPNPIRAASISEGKIDFSFHYRANILNYHVALAESPGDPSLFRGRWLTGTPPDQGACWCLLARKKTGGVELIGHWTEGDEDYSWKAQLVPKKAK
jgi:hypothetical protein